MRTIALLGNPNCGKTTLFNALTGSRQTVGNWPGVTVEWKEGSYEWKGEEIRVIDLPGIYSFAAKSADEQVARDFLFEQQPDLIINVVDASNLKRNLYLTIQLLELHFPTVLALNMMDMAEQHHIRIEIEHLSQHLQCPVYPVSASRREGIDALKDAIMLDLQSNDFHFSYDEMVEKAVVAIEPLVQKEQFKNYPSRWIALQLLENDRQICKQASPAILEPVKHWQTILLKHSRLEADLLIADGRYGYINGLIRDVMHQEDPFGKRFSDTIDKVILNKVLGIPLFLLIMFLTFSITIKIGQPFLDFFDQFFGALLVDGFGHLLQSWGTPSWLEILLANGLGGGIQTIATFIPPVFFIFLCLSILEDSGYMARAAFVMDKMMRKIGLPGKAFLPMLVGFGCTVPAILATRTLEHKRDRVLTILMNPFMSCGAKLPVYTFFTAIFFTHNGSMVIFGLYIIGVLLSIGSGLLFQKTILASPAGDFVIELPPYHMPTINGIFMHTWHRLRSFVLRAGKTILGVIILLSLINSIKVDGSINMNGSSDSILSEIGKVASPIFKPMGIEKDNWPATVGLVTGIFSKESVIGSLQSLYPTGEIQKDADFQLLPRLREAFTALPAGFVALVKPTKNNESVPSQLKQQIQEKFRSDAAVFAYLLFILIYSPCVAALATMQKEIGLRWTIFAVSYLTLLAWLIATLYYQIAMWAYQPRMSMFWVGVVAVVSIGVYILLRSIGSLSRNERSQ